MPEVAGMRVCVVFSPQPAASMVDNVLHSLNGNHFKKSQISVELLSVTGRPQAIVHL